MLGTQKSPRERGLKCVVSQKECLLAHAAEFGVELLNAASAIDETFFAGISRVRIRGYVLNNNLVFNSVDRFGLFGFYRGLSKKFLS